MSEPLVSVVIVSWNGRELLKRCLASLQRWITYPYEVVVIDNASTDQSPAMVASDFPSVQLIRNAKNRGFAAANNQGLAATSGTFVVLLNPDTELRHEPFQPIIDYLQQNQQAAVAGPEILNSDESHQQSVRNFPTWADQALTLLKLRQLLKHVSVMKKYLNDPGEGVTEPRSVDQIMGACMIIRRSVIETVGDLDEGYFIWFEEVDYCRRIKQAGYQVVYVPLASIVHHGGTSFAQVLSLKKQLWFMRSLSRYVGKFWNPLAAWSLRAIMPVSYGLTILQTLVKPR